METSTKNVNVGMVNTSPENNVYGILNSFNALTLEQPQDAISSSVGIIGESIDVSATQGNVGNYSGSYQEFSSQEELTKSLAVSVGIKGHYGFYSGSFNGSYKTSYHQMNTSLNSAWIASIDHGNAAYVGSQDNILSSLKPSIQAQLKGIQTLQDAKTFIEQYGTHVITKVKRGGNLFIAIQANTTSETQKTTISAQVRAAYEAGGKGISTTVSTVSELEPSYATQQITQNIVTVGGSPFSGGASKANYLINWANSVTPASLCGVLESLAFWEIPGIAGTTAATKLQDYVQYQLLMNSLENPLIVSNTGYMSPGNPSSVSTKILPAGYKIVGGGAATQENTNNYLTGSFPSFNGAASIQQWTANAHDCMAAASPTDTLTAYAVAVYDPFNLMEVHVAQNSKNSTLAGAMQVLVDYATPAVTGGGLNAEAKSGSFPKYVTCNVYQPDCWNTEVHDYVNASNDITLTAYAISVSVPSNIISVQSGFTAKSDKSEWVTINTPVPAGKRVIGGGSGIAKTNNAAGGNLYKQCFPNAETNEFHSYSSDLDGRGTVATAVTRALYLDVSFTNLDS